MAHRFLSEFKQYLGREVSNVDKDFLLETCLSGAESFIESNYNLPLVETTITETLDGDDTNYLYLNYRVSSVSSLTVDEELVDPSDIYIKSGVVRLISGTFSEGIQNIEITYTCGWADLNLPSALKVALFSLAGMMFKEADEARTGVEGWNTNTKTGMDYVVQHLPPTFEKLVSPYRVIRF